MLSRFASFAFLCVFALASARAAEPFLKPNDVIALLGGEDMVAASEYGYLELLLQRALPDYKLKVRSLAWEGDTVFDQPRDLNYPTLEAQLDEIGATVVVMQFGQMESLAGTSKLPEFIKAYEKLIERVKAGKRRVVVASPSPFYDTGASVQLPVAGWPEKPWKTWAGRARIESRGYFDAIKGLEHQGVLFVDTTNVNLTRRGEWRSRDGVHLDKSGHLNFAVPMAMALTDSDRAMEALFDPPYIKDGWDAIRAKNRLWFHYYRPQNWAFLAGDRTEQPSSRDHKDPSKRWFPEEMKQWLPLIDAKEKEIWALAAKAAKDGSTKDAKNTK